MICTLCGPHFIGQCPHGLLPKPVASRFKDRIPGTFGRTLRATRLGYRHVDALGAWVRISDDGDEHARIDVVPYDYLPHDPPKKWKLFRAWWEADDKGAGLLSVCEALRTLKPDEPVVLFVDMDGREVRRMAP